MTSNWTVPGRHSGGPYEYFPRDISADLCASFPWHTQTLSSACSVWLRTFRVRAVMACPCSLATSLSFPMLPATRRFERLRIDIDWGIKADASTCVSFSALDLGQRGFVPVNQLDEVHVC